MSGGLKSASRLLAGFALAAAVVSAAPAQQGPIGVDLALVLAVDVSNSMDEDEQAVQRQGYIDAFNHMAVLNAIRSGGEIGRIAVAYLEWAEESKVVVNWTIIRSNRDAANFAEKLADAPLGRGPLTSISNGLTAAETLLNTPTLKPTRRVIDLSGDGSSNTGEPVEPVRDRLVENGVVINGLPLALRPPRYDVPDIEAYYRQCVQGGKGSFVMAVKSVAEIGDTIREKLITEIADLGPRASMVIPAQATVPRPKPDCNPRRAMRE